MHGVSSTSDVNDTACISYVCCDEALPGKGAAREEELHRAAPRSGGGAPPWSASASGRSFLRQLLSGFVVFCFTVLLPACARTNSIASSATPAISASTAEQGLPLASPERMATYTAQASTPISSMNNIVLRSPEVNADRTVTLRLFAPNAASVTATGDFGDLILTKDAQGIWSATTEPLEPAVYIYHFDVDGVQMADPYNPDNKGISESLFIVPGDPPMPWELRNVPHGDVTQVLYFSQVFNTHRRFFVYTPPGYDETANKLPVLYLLHGYSDDDSAWTIVGKANLIADSLLADGKIEPMLIVMPYGQFDSHVTIEHCLDDDFQEKYEEQILTEIIPYVEQAFHAAPDAQHRAMAGLSMGGFQAAIIGLNHPEIFSTIGIWSPAFFGNPSVLLGRLVAAPDDLKHSFLYVHVGVGQEDSLLARSYTIDEFLTQQDIAHEFTVTPGTHSWVVWRGYLVDFLPRFSTAAQ
jgi:enterochelin esterase-like enzyme